MLRLLSVQTYAHFRTLGLSKCRSKGTVLVQSKANTLQNGSYIYGISSMGDEARKALADGVSWEDFSKSGGTVPA